MRWFEAQAADRWEPYDPSVILTGGPDRVVRDEPHDDLPYRPLGFRDPKAGVAEPLTWEGDGA